MFLSTFSEAARFQTLPSSWQAALVEKTESKEFIWELFDKKVVLNPRVLEALSDKVKALGEPEKIREFATARAKNAITPNQRMSFIDFLKKNYSIEENIATFLDLLEKDPSPLVRKKVAEHLGQVCEESTTKMSS